MKVRIGFFLFCCIALSFLLADEAELPLKEGIYLTTDAIVWNVRESGLSYAIENKESALIADKGNVHNPHFNWSIGFKAGAGYRFPKNLWELGIELMRLHLKAPTHTSEKEGAVFFPIWTNAAIVGSGNVDTVESRWRLHCGTLDLMLGRNFYPLAEVLVKPSFGLQGAILRQKGYFLYQGGTLFPNGEDRVSMKNKFMGGGPRLALDMEWFFVNGWSIYALGGLSLLYGDFYIHQTEKATLSPEQRLKIFNRFHDTSVATDLGLGIAYEGHWLHGCLWQIHAGWEQHVFFDQNHLIRFVGAQQGSYASTSGNLSFQGWDLGIRLEF